MKLVFATLLALLSTESHAYSLSDLATYLEGEENAGNSEAGPE